MLEQDRECWGRLASFREKGSLVLASVDQEEEEEEVEEREEEEALERVTDVWWWFMSPSPRWRCSGEW